MEIMEHAQYYSQNCKIKFPIKMKNCQGILFKEDKNFLKNYYLCAKIAIIVD